MKKFFTGLFIIALFVFGVYLMVDGISGIIGDKVDTTIENKTLLNPGESFEKGKYIEIEGVEILYNGKSFLVQNKRSDIVRVTCSIVGVKKDGTYETIQIASFSGVDETQYERDKAENGWAVKKNTNMIRPNETLEASLTYYDFNKTDSSYPPNDVDDDGYIDIVFTISPQTDETTIISSTDDFKSETYKLKDK